MPFMQGEQAPPVPTGRVALWPRESPTRGEYARAAAGPNAYGEQLQPGRVTDCYLGILFDQPLAEIAPEPGRVLVVAPAALLDEQVPQPHGQVLYDLVSGHPHRAPRELVFLADLALELRAWPQQTWSAVGISPEAALFAGGGPLAHRLAQGVGARRCDRRGGPRARPAPHGLPAGAAPPTPRSGDQPPVPALATPHQPPSARREVPVADDGPTPRSVQLPLKEAQQVIEGLRSPSPDASLHRVGLAGHWRFEPSAIAGTPRRSAGARRVRRWHRAAPSCRAASPFRRGARRAGGGGSRPSEDRCQQQACRAGGGLLPCAPCG
jgi:hypothetical protein